MRNKTINKRNHLANSRLSSYFAKRLRRTDSNESGFTLIELIVVISVIGILASIVIVSYGSWKQSTTKAQLKSDLSGVAAAMENARTFGNTYPTTIPSTFIPSNGVTLSGGGVNSGKGYCVDATNGTQSYNISSQYSTPTVGPCPVLYLDAGIAASYPGTGNTWTDLSGNGNNGMLVNGPTYSSSNGGSLGFNYDIPNYVTVALANSFNKTEGTINFWINPTRYSGGNGYFVNREDATPNATDWFWIGPYSDTFYFRIGNGSDCCSNDLSFGSVSTVIPINTWTNMSFTWKINGTSAIYKNGILLTSRSIGNIPNTNPATNGRFGLGHSNGPSYFDGKMSVVQSYNRALSSGEISQNFNALRGRFGI